jgi:Second Messenger Oligonucleotide or Dinucleotide Synthetase domain
MNQQLTQPPLGPNAPLGELLLAETAIRIELPPSQHRLAVDRYEAIRKYIERVGSPLRDRVRIFYPQGSMAIRATILSRKRADGFDIDIIAELILSHSTAPAAVLDLLFLSINGPPGSQYHGKVERQTRCVTVYYADGMHLDITPTLLVADLDPRLSHLFHAKREEPVSAHRRLLMNSFAFCEWVNEKAPIDLAFEEAYGRRALAFDALRMRADAEVRPVPAHSTKEGGKSAKIVALQLLKRNRKVRYERRGGRLPPSVMLAKMAAEAVTSGASIAWALDAISAKVLGALEDAERTGVLIDVRNPRCEDECLTDRWPEDRQAQRLYISDLRLFRTQVANLMSEEYSLPQKRDLLVAMFGVGPAKAVIDEYVATLGRAVETGKRYVTPSGRVIPATVATGAAAASAAFAQPRPHTFFGTRWLRK